MKEPTRADPYVLTPDAVQEPPRTLSQGARADRARADPGGLDRRHGRADQHDEPGRQGGVRLLWLILLSCVIKVFVQVELGPVRDHARQDDAGGVQHAARTPARERRGSAGSICS